MVKVQGLHMQPRRPTASRLEGWPGLNVIWSLDYEYIASLRDFSSHPHSAYRDSCIESLLRCVCKSRFRTQLSYSKATGKRISSIWPHSPYLMHLFPCKRCHQQSDIFQIWMSWRIKVRLSDRSERWMLFLRSYSLQAVRWTMRMLQIIIELSTFK